MTYFCLEQLKLWRTIHQRYAFSVSEFSPSKFSFEHEEGRLQSSGCSAGAKREKRKDRRFLRTMVILGWNSPFCFLADKASIIFSFEILNLLAAPSFPFFLIFFKQKFRQAFSSTSIHLLSSNVKRPQIYQNFQEGTNSYFWR